MYAFVIDRLTERREVVDVNTTMVYEQVQPRRIDPATAGRPRSLHRPLTGAAEFFGWSA